MEYFYFKAYSFNNEIRLSQKNSRVCVGTHAQSQRPTRYLSQFFHILMLIWLDC